MKSHLSPNKATYGGDTDAYGSYSSYDPPKNLYSVQYRKNAHQISSISKANQERRGYLGDKTNFRNASREADDLDTSGIKRIDSYSEKKKINHSYEPTWVDNLLNYYRWKRVQ
jgi:hypothetical protein